VFVSDPYLYLTFRSFPVIAKLLDAASLTLFLHLGTSTTRPSLWYVEDTEYVSMKLDFFRLLTSIDS
jgi:hypothetical protein